MILPIELVPNTHPPLFRWKQVVETPIGSRTTEQHGYMPASLEGAVVSLINCAKQLMAENEELRRQLERPKTPGVVPTLQTPTIQKKAR